MIKVITAFGKRVLIISDLHAPYSHPDWYHFLKAIKKKYKPDIIISVGDEVDGHGISFHDKDSALLNASAELEKAIEDMQLLRELFPKMYICESNHGSLIYRKMKHHGVPIRHLKPLPQLYGTPRWQWFFEIKLRTRLGDVLINHGKSAGYGAFAKESMCSGVQGHFHGKSEITWHRSSNGMRFNMFVGCLVDERSPAMDYGKNFLKKPIMSVGFIDERGEPFLIRMNLNKEGRWDGRL